jgi:hypothetical protein
MLRRVALRGENGPWDPRRLRWSGRLLLFLLGFVLALALLVRIILRQIAMKNKHLFSEMQGR